MIFRRTLRRELISTAGAVFMTLFTVTLTMMLIRILGQAAKGRVASDDVIALIGFSTLYYLPIILILTGFISVLFVITRSYRDSEMVVWFASGQSLTQWLKPVLDFAIPVVMLIALMGFICTPWAHKQGAAFRYRFEKREDLARVSPGKFQESASTERVFFVEGISDDLSKVKNVFIRSHQKGQENIVVAKEGTTKVDENGDRFLILADGYRYEKSPSKNEFQIMDFERYIAYIAPKSTPFYGDGSMRALSTIELFYDMNQHKKGELLWRIALPFMAFLLMLIAIPLSFVNPRAGRSFNLILAALIYVSYSNLSSLLQANVFRGRISFGLAWWPLHAVVALITLGLFLWRLKINSRYHPLMILSSIRYRRLTEENG